MPCVSAAFVAKTLPLTLLLPCVSTASACVFHCVRGSGTAFALRVPLPSRPRRCLCLACSTAFATKPLPLPCVSHRRLRRRLCLVCSPPSRGRRVSGQALAAAQKEAFEECTRATTAAVGVAAAAKTPVTTVDDASRAQMPPLSAKLPPPLVPSSPPRLAAKGIKHSSTARSVP